MIPRGQRQEILQQLHIRYFGIEKTKHGAKMLFISPASTRTSRPTLVSVRYARTRKKWAWATQNAYHLIPTRPFQDVAVDLFECDNYLSLQDYYNRYIEVEMLYSTTFVITKLKGIFASILRQWAAIRQCRICTFHKYMVIHPCNIESPIPAIKWPSGEGGTDRRKNHNDKQADETLALLCMRIARCHCQTAENHPRNC